MKLTWAKVSGVGVFYTKAAADAPKVKGAVVATALVESLEVQGSVLVVLHGPRTRVFSVAHLEEAEGV